MEQIIRQLTREAEINGVDVKDFSFTEGETYIITLTKTLSLSDLKSGEKYRLTLADEYINGNVQERFNKKFKNTVTIKSNNIDVEFWTMSSVYIKCRYGDDVVIIPRNYILSIERGN